MISTYTQHSEQKKKKIIKLLISWIPSKKKKKHNLIDVAYMREEKRNLI